MVAKLRLHRYFLIFECLTLQPNSIFFCPFLHNSIRCNEIKMSPLLQLFSYGTCEHRYYIKQQYKKKRWSYTALILDKWQYKETVGKKIHLFLANHNILDFFAWCRQGKIGRPSPMEICFGRSCSLENFFWQKLLATTYSNFTCNWTTVNYASISQSNAVITCNVKNTGWQLPLTSVGTGFHPQCSCLGFVKGNLWPA